MFDGLWILEFSSTLDRYGTGVLVIDKNRLLGGDDSYYYSGKCSINDGKIEGSLMVIRYDTLAPSVFGDNLDHFEIQFSGKINKYNLSVIGSLVGLPHQGIKVNGIKKEDLL